MDPDSRPRKTTVLPKANRWVSQGLTKGLGEPYMVPKLRADGPKVERPVKKEIKPPQLTPDQQRVGAILQLERNRLEATNKLAKRGYRTQTEHEFIKLRWPNNKPMV